MSILAAINQFIALTDGVEIPTTCGVYVKRFVIAGAECFYVGISKNLNERLTWHSQPRYSRNAILSGFVSTLTITLAALHSIPYTEENLQGPINELATQCDTFFLALPCIGDCDEMETSLLNEHVFTLNIAKNKHRYSTKALRYLRKINKQNTLKLMNG